MWAEQRSYWRSAAQGTRAELADSFRIKGLSRNIAAGISTALVALPLNIALALACELPASVGLWTGAIAGLLGALLGGSKLQITGPEVALAPLTLQIVLTHGYEGLLWCTVIAGLFQIVLGLARIGRLVQAVPAPVIAGFMAAVGLMVLDGQIPRLLGMPDEVRTLSSVIGTDAAAATSLNAIRVGVFAVLCVVFLPKLHPRIPAPLVAVGVPILAVTVFALQIPHVPDVDGAIPPLGLSAIGLSSIVELIPSALALAMLASLDSLLSAVSMDAKTHTRHRSDQELVAQGLANIACGFVGAMPVAGAIVRSATALDAGADNRLAPIAQSVVLGLVFLLLGAHLDHIPLAALAAILCVVGVKLIQPSRFVELYRHSRADLAIAAVTVCGILALDFVLGVTAGVVAALARLGMSRANLGIHVEHDHGRGLASYRIEGPLVFANVARLSSLLAVENAPMVVIDFSAVPELDFTATEVIDRAIGRLCQRNVDVQIHTATPELAAQLRAAVPNAKHAPSRLLDGLPVPQTPFA